MQIGLFRVGLLRTYERRTGRLRIESPGGGGHVEVLVRPRGTSLLEDIDGAGPVADLPVGFRHIPVDHGGGARPVLGLRQRQRLPGAPETRFAAGPVAVEDLVAGQRAVGQSKGPAVERVGPGALVRPGEPGDLLPGEAYGRLLVAAVGRFHGRHLVGLAGAGRQGQGARRDRDPFPEGMTFAATAGRAGHFRSLVHMADGSAPGGSLSEARTIANRESRRRSRRCTQASLHREMDAGRPATVRVRD